MNLAQTTIAIARLPIGIVAGAYNKYNPSPVAGITKTDAARWLAQAVCNNELTIDQINAAPPSTLTTAPAVDPAVVAKVDATASVAAQAQHDAVKALGELSSLSDMLRKVATVTTDNNDRLNHLADKVGQMKIDDRSLEVAVDKVIGDHFGKFAKLVEDRQAESFIADLTKVHRIGSDTCLNVFGVDVGDINGQPLMVDLWNSPDAPAVDPDFIWTESILRHLLLSDRTGENLWFGGDKGTGKSETARQFAARTGRSFKRINFHKHTTVEEYIGAVGIEGGKTVFQPKDFLTAYAAPSSVILLDEITNADPAELATLNGFLEPNACVSFGGLTHTRAEGVLVFVADNTFGSGDDTGRYAGTRLQNSALIDRFARVIAFDFLPQNAEIKAIASRAGCSEKLAKHIHDAIVIARQRVKTADIVDAPSIRSAIAFARALTVLPARDAWLATVVARQPSESHATLVGIFDACINEETIKKYL